MAVPVSSNQLKLVELSPRGAILESWLELEEVISERMEKENIPQTRLGGLEGRRVTLDTYTKSQLLLASGILTDISYERFQKLRKIRNNAVHLKEDVISPDEAEVFVRLVAQLKLEIKNS